jgi:hypothetical protein
MAGRRQNATSPRQTLPIRMEAHAKATQQNHCFNMIFYRKIAAWI